MMWQPFLYLKVCCSKIQAPCRPDSVWVAAPVGRWTPDSVQLSISNVCSSAEEVMAIRYAWKDWPCSFKACPVYSASRILPAPPFIINRYAAPTTWKHSGWYCRLIQPNAAFQIYSENHHHHVIFIKCKTLITSSKLWICKFESLTIH